MNKKSLPQNPNSSPATAAQTATTVEQLRDKWDRARKWQPSKPWILQVLLPAILVIIFVILIVILLYKYYCGRPRILNTTSWLLSGTEGWVKGKQWTAINPDSKEVLATSDERGYFTIDFPLNAKVAVTQADWTANYLFTNEKSPQCVTVNADDNLYLDCLPDHPIGLVMNHDLDVWLANWRDAIMLRQWNKLTDVTTMPNDTTATLDQQLNTWIENLVNQGWTPESLEFYVEIYQASLNTDAQLFWTLTNATTGAKQIHTTRLSLTPNHDTWSWGFTLEALPQL